MDASLQTRAEQLSPEDRQADGDEQETHPNQRAALADSVFSAEVNAADVSRIDAVAP